MVIKKLALLTGLILCPLIMAQDMFGDDKQSYVLLPAEVISSGIVGKVQFSHSGRYITYQKKEIASFESSLLGISIPSKNQWFRYDRKTKGNLKIQVPETTDEIATLGDDRSVYFSGAENNDPQGFLNLQTGSVSKTTFKLESISYWGERSDAPYFIVKQSETSVALVRPSGQTITIPVPRKLSIFRPISSDTKLMTFSAIHQNSPSKFGHLIYQFDTGTSSFVETSRDEARRETTDDSPRSRFWFESVGDLSYVKLLDLPRNFKTDLPTRAKLGTSNCTPLFGPSSDCVAYQDAGALLIRDVKPIDSDLAKKLLAKKNKEKAMSDAKQAAMSLMIYASDMDDVLPGAEGWETKVNPYCLDEALLKNFNYTFKGGSLSSIGNPATTELGFTLAPGGRAIAYCDGHVKWVPDP